MPGIVDAAATTCAHAIDARDISAVARCPLSHAVIEKQQIGLSER
jgi:hypothetical protein